MVDLDAVVEIAHAVKDGTLTLEEADAAIAVLAVDDGQPEPPDPELAGAA